MPIFLVFGNTNLVNKTLGSFRPGRRREFNSAYLRIPEGIRFFICLPSEKGVLMKIGIIGAGKVGQALVRSFLAQGQEVIGITSAALENAEQTAIRLGVNAFANNAALAAVCDLIFLTVPDRLIGEVAAELAQYIQRLGLNHQPGQVLAGKTFFHCSGSLGLEVLEPLAALGAEIGSLHPLQSFASPKVSFTGVYMAVDGTEAAQALGIKLAKSLAAIPFQVPAKERKAYHAAACFASNYVVTALAVAQKLMSQWTATPEAALAALMPLVDGTVNNLHQADLARQALTGPIARGDVNTVQGHLAVLPPEFLTVYCTLGEETLKLAQENQSLTEEQASHLTEVLQEHSRAK